MVIQGKLYEGADLADRQERVRRTNDMSTSKTVLFYRDFQVFSGGHLKVWDYYQHLVLSGVFRPKIFFSEQTAWTPDNPWFGLSGETEEFWIPEQADILFLAGLDWLMIERRALPSSTPIINLIQGVCHADPNDRRYQFLSQRAIRICVSEQVAMCLRATKRVNGPIYTIPNGLDLGRMPLARPHPQRDISVLIAGLKNRPLAEYLAVSLAQRGIRAELLLGAMPREAFLDRLSRANIVVLLPHEQEGFFLPALEAMALEALVVCPDCVGNRSFCLNGVNSFRPCYDPERILHATLRAAELSDREADDYRRAGLQTAAEHDLMRERGMFLEIMENVEQIW